MAIKNITIDTYTADAETVAYTNNTTKQALILLLQVSRDAGVASTCSIWLKDGDNNKIAVYVPTNTNVAAYAVLSDTDKHVVPPGHKVVFTCSAVGNYIELTVNEGMD